MDWAEILAETIRDAAGGLFTVYEYQPVTPQPPCIYVGLPDFRDFRDSNTMRGTAPSTIPITFVFGLGDTTTAQKNMRAAMYGPIPEAIAKIQTGDVIKHVQLQDFSNTRVEDGALLTDLNVVVQH